MRKLTLVLFAVLLAFNGISNTDIKKKGKKDEANPYKYTWNLTEIYSDWDAWQKDLDFIKANINKYNDYKGKLGLNAETFLSYQKFSDETSKIIMKLYSYVMLHQDTDGKNPMYNAKRQELQSVLIEQSKNTAWIQPEISKIPKSTMESWMEANKELTTYEHDMDAFYSQLEHILDEETVKTLSYFSKALSASQNAYRSLSISDMDYPKVTLSDGKEVTVSPGAYMQIATSNPNQEDRKKAGEALREAYVKNKNTYADIWLGIANNRWGNAQLQGYESCLESVLSPNNIPKDVYLNLIDVASNNNEPLKRYAQLRKKVLNLEKYYGSDGRYPLVDYKKSYKYDDAVELVVKSLDVFGKEYNDLLATSIQGGWIDVFEKEGKATGAYNLPLYGVHPYILLNWDETQDIVYTLAHELGHAIHGMLGSTYQPYTYARSATMIAEVASTFNEYLLLDYMIENSKDPKEKIQLLIQAIENISGTFYTQSQFAEFEYKAYSMVEQGQPLNADILANLYDQISDKYNGDVYEKSELGKYSWPRVQHFFSLYYYVYNYAVSFSASSSIYEQLKSAESKKEKQQVVDRYLNLLKSGSNGYPVDLLKTAGVDLTTKDPFLAVTKRMEELVNQLEAELKAIGKI